MTFKPPPEPRHPGETWETYTRRIAAHYGLESEVMEAFGRYIETGDDPAEASFCALYDWDI